MPLSSYSWFIPKLGWMNTQLIYLDLLVIHAMPTLGWTHPQLFYLTIFFLVTDAVDKILYVHAKAGLDTSTSTPGPPCHRFHCAQLGWTLPQLIYQDFLVIDATVKLGWILPKLIYLDLHVIDAVDQILSVHAKAGLNTSTAHLPGPPCHRCH